MANLRASMRVRRLFAEVLAGFSYRRFQKYYWSLRSSDLVERYSHDSDFATVKGLLLRFQCESVLDAGCGNGRLFPVFAEAGVKRVIAIEQAGPLFQAAQEVARSASKRGQPVFELYQQNLTSLRLPDSKVDFLLSSRVLQHIPPEMLGTVLGNLLRHSPRGIYLNENQIDRPLMRHEFLHDYESVLKGYGYRLVERGEIPTIGYEFMVFTHES